MDTPFRKLRLLEWLTLLLAVCVLMAQNASPQALTQSPQLAETQSNTAIQPARTVRRTTTRHPRRHADRPAA